ncbi:Modification methylase BspRI [compost metagenome]
MEITLDGFAGGGGASAGYKRAMGRSPHIAINHDDDAISMHMVNHSDTRHYREDIWAVDPLEATGGRPVGFAWWSPDCTHFSVARGGKPVEKNIRSLAWVVLRWVATVAPRVNILENVKEFLSWGPLLPNGKPDPARKGETFRSFVRQLERHGYKVEWRVLKACDYGAPTSRERLYMAFRRDGKPIVWPKQTHGAPDSIEVLNGKLKPWRTAAECIDWSIPVPSIFGRKKELAENTKRRIAKGIMKFVVDSPKPYIVPGGVGFVSRIGHTGFGGDRLSYALDDPLTTITSKAEHLLVTAFLQQYYTSDTARGQALDQPIMTIPTENRFGLVTAHICKFRGSNIGSPADAPLQTISAGGTHHALVQAFLIKYYGASTGQSLNDPVGTIVSKDRFGLVYVSGTPYQIVDIGMRMLQPHELFAGQGFPEDYNFTHGHDGRKFTKKAQVDKCGNSVCPDMAEVLISSNYKPDLMEVAL